MSFFKRFKRDPDPLCHCGLPIHYKNPHIKWKVSYEVYRLGPWITVTAAGRSWRVQRHYLALHGIKADELPNLGFVEIVRRK